MKKLLIIASFLLLSLLSNGQDIIHSDFTGKTYDWLQVNNKCYNCASVYFKITRSISPVNKAGQYYYQVLFFSNSFDAQGYLRSTYLTNVNVQIAYPQSKQSNYFYVAHQNYILVPLK